MDRKKYEFPLNLKSMKDNGHFAGYASVFNIEDNHNDMILSGAFSNSLNKKHYGKDIKLLWQHKTDEPIGVFTKIVEDEHGLYVEGKLLLDVERAREAYSLVSNGALKGLSIGFIVKQYEHDDSGVRIIYEADLWEISLVTFPANENARITELKSFSTKSYNHDDECLRLTDSIDNLINILKEIR